MARDQFSIHLSRAGTAVWHVDTVRFETPLGRHGIYPVGLTIAQVFRDALAEVVEEIAQAIGPDQHILSCPDFHRALAGLTLKGVFGHLDRLANGLVRLTIRFCEVIGDVLSLLNDRHIEAQPRDRGDADAVALAAIEGVLLPLMNSVEALRARLSDLDADPRLPTALMQVSQCSADLRRVIRRVLDDGEATLPPLEGATGRESILPMLLAAWSSDAQRPLSRP